GNRLVRAHAYPMGGMRPEATISVRILRDTRRNLTAGWIALGLLVAFLWPLAGRGSRSGQRDSAVVLTALVFLPLAAAALANSWADDRHRELTEHHLAQSVRAFELARGAGAELLQATAAASSPWASREALANDDEFWTMPPSLAASLPADVTGFITIRAAGVPYGVTSADDVVFGRPSYEATASVLIPTAAAVLGTLLLTVLILSLRSLADQPRILRDNLTAWAFLAPSAGHLLFFTLGPLLFSLWLSLHDWTLVDQAHPWVGLGQYRRLASDGGWWAAVGNTLVFTLHVPVAMAVALILALLTQSSHRAMRWARMALFLPSVTSIVAIAVVWKWLLNENYGLVNRLLATVGLGPVAWLSSPDTALITLMLIGIWLVVGYQMVVFQAGLASIPKDWYDAAQVDGTGPWRTFWHITLPGLRRTLFFVLVTSVIGSFQVFGLVYVMTEGGPLGATDVAVFHIYREAWEYLQFGSAAAMSWMFFAVVFAATWLHFRLLDKGPGRVHG
ncbi:MAG: sugar ABC transporter permease, partial [Gemmatimonadota bacterium]|nr:sugar ABC transporter permease [Gemmatimonadota bacterium]